MTWLTVYLNKADAVSALGDNRGAVALYDQAIAIRERLVNQEGRRELVGDLAQLKAYRGDGLDGARRKGEGYGGHAFCSKSFGGRGRPHRSS